MGAYQGGAEGRPGRLRLSYRGPDDVVDRDDGGEVSLSDLVEHVRRGGRFEAVDEHTGGDCTLLVLAQMIGVAMPRAAGGGLLDLLGGSPNT